jgi:hypothetical protein
MMSGHLTNLPILMSGQISEELIIEPDRNIEYSSNPMPRVCKDFLSPLNVETVNCDDVDSDTRDRAKIPDHLLLANETPSFECLEEVKLGIGTHF